MRYSWKNQVGITVNQPTTTAAAAPTVSSLRNNYNTTTTRVSSSFYLLLYAMIIGATTVMISNHGTTNNNITKDKIVLTNDRTNHFHPFQSKQPEQEQQPFNRRRRIRNRALWNPYYNRNNNNRKYVREYVKPNRRPRRNGNRRRPPKPNHGQQTEHLKQLNNGGGRPPRGPVVLDQGRSLVAKLRNYSDVGSGQLVPMGSVRLNFRQNNQILDSIWINGSGLGYNYTVANDINVAPDETPLQIEAELLGIRQLNQCRIPFSSFGQVLSGEIAITSSWSNTRQNNALNAGTVCLVAIYSATECSSDPNDFGDVWYRSDIYPDNPFVGKTNITNNARTQIRGDTILVGNSTYPGNGYNLQQNQGRIVVVYNQRGQNVACGILERSS